MAIKDHVKYNYLLSIKMSRAKNGNLCRNLIRQMVEKY